MSLGFRVLKTIRDAAATVLAAVLFRVPALEVPYSHFAHAVLDVPIWHPLCRETTDRLVARLERSGRAFRRLQCGPVTALFDVSRFTTKGQYFARRPYEEGATTMVLGLREGDTFVDVGANSGYFTVLAALRVGPRGRVYSFEPNPDVRRQLERHLALNAIEDRVVVVDVALSDENREGARLYVSCVPENDGLSSLTPNADALALGGLREHVVMPVPVVRFDGWRESVGLTRIDLVKIDVEGAELKVLKGMTATLSQVRPTRIVCETPRGGEAARLLSDAGYRVSVLDEIPNGVPNLLFE